MNAPITYNNNNHRHKGNSLYRRYTNSSSLQHWPLGLQLYQHINNNSTAACSITTYSCHIKQDNIGHKTYTQIRPKFGTKQLIRLYLQIIAFDKIPTNNPTKKYLLVHTNDYDKFQLIPAN